MFAFLKKIFLGENPDFTQKADNAYKQQIGYLKQIWNDKTYGLERIFRLFLCLVQFIYPAILVKSIFSNSGKTGRRLSVEVYIIIKLLFPVFVLISGLYRYYFVILLIVYLLSETIFHVLNLIFYRMFIPFAYHTCVPYYYFLCIILRSCSTFP